jgi:hypothetical protein
MKDINDMYLKCTPKSEKQRIVRYSQYDQTEKPLTKPSDSLFGDESYPRINHLTLGAYVEYQPLQVLVRFPHLTTANDGQVDSLQVAAERAC